jgi:hypothetical protein
MSWSKTLPDSDGAGQPVTTTCRLELVTCWSSCVTSGHTIGFTPRMPRCPRWLPAASFHRTYCAQRVHVAAAIYGVETQVFIQAIKRNAARFPQDFTFQLTAPKRGVAMLSSLLYSDRAIVVNIQTKGPPHGGPDDPIAARSLPSQKGYAKVKKSNRSSSAGVFNGT